MNDAIQAAKTCGFPTQRVEDRLWFKFLKNKDNERLYAAHHCLTTKAEALDEGLITILIGEPQVLQQTTTTTNQLEKTTT
jgi:hypothetical protein